MLDNLRVFSVFYRARVPRSPRIWADTLPLGGGLDERR